MKSLNGIQAVVTRGAPRLNATLNKYSQAMGSKALC